MPERRHSTAVDVGRAVGVLERKWWALIVLCVGLFMLLLDITIVNIALPDLSVDLHASFSDLQWVIDAYALSLASVLLVAGSLGDLVGDRLVFLVGLAIFCVSSLLCGMAQDPTVLITFRAVQGIGGAGMFASSLALLAQEFRGRDRGVALGVWGATAGAAVAIGPLVGGALTSGASWRWIFLINVPIGAMAFVVALLRVHETQRRPGVRPDWAGFVVLGVSLVGIIYGLIRGNAEGWGSGRILGSFVAGAVLLVAFIVLEYRQSHPMLDLRLFGNPALVGASIAALAIAASLFSMLLYFALYLQDILGYSAFGTGWRLLPLSALTLLIAPIAGRVTARLPLRLMIGTGLGLIAVGLALMTAVSATSGWMALLAGMIVAGIGSGLTNPALASAAVGTVGDDEAGIGSGISNTFRQIGVAVGIAGLGAIFQHRVRTAFVADLIAREPRLAGRAGDMAKSVSAGSGPHTTKGHGPYAQVIATVTRSAFVSGLDRILWVAAIAAAVGAVAGAVLITSRGISSSGVEQPMSERRDAPVAR